MQYKNSKKIMIDQRKLESLFRLGCPDKQIVDLLKTGKFTPTNDSLIDDTLESLIDYRVFENWGGTRKGAGRKSKKSAKNNHLENQVDNQDEKHLVNQDANQLAFQVVDKDKDIDNIKNSKFNKDSIIYVNGQYFDEFPPESVPLLKKHWSLEELEDIRKRMAFKPEHQTTVAQMLVEYPPKPKKKDFVPPTLEEWRAFCKELKLDIKRLESIYYGYSENNWRDSHGNQIKNWKMKIRQVWDKPENKDPDADIVGEVKIIELVE